MGYDKGVDIQIFSTEWIDDKNKFKVGIFSYDGGEKKVQITKERYDGIGWKFSKVGRMTKKEALAVNEMIKKACETI